MVCDGVLVWAHMESYSSLEVAVPHLPLKEKGKRETVVRDGVHPFVLWQSNEIHCGLKNNKGKMQVNDSRLSRC